MNYNTNPIGRIDMIAWLSLQDKEPINYDEMSDDEIRVLYEERRKGSDDYIDNYNEAPEPFDDEPDIDEKTR